MSDAEEKARQEKLAAVKKRAELLRKKKQSQQAAATPDEPEASAANAAEEGLKPLEISGSKLPELSSPSVLSPNSLDGDTAADIYRKQVARIAELEKENKRLTKETAELEQRWQKSEAELADLREAEDGDAAGKGGDRDEIASLRRQNSQLQQQIARGHGHAHRPSVSVASPEPALQAELDAKSATIEAMEIELSKLRARVDRQENGASSEKEQILALEDKVARAEAAAGKAQRELHDVKKNLERATDRAVREGSARSSAETKANTLTSQLDEATRAREELEKRADALDKKAAALTTLHKEQDARFQALRRDKEKAEAEAAALRERVDKRASRSSTDGGLDDEGVDELEDEGRLRLERKIRSLEAEVHELRSGAWIERRREMEATSPAFHDVDLGGGGVGSAPPPPSRAKGSVAGIGDLITHGLNALAGGPASGAADEFLEDDDDDDMGFDEDAFRRAHEEQAMRRLERIKEVKRSLKHWEGWRLDIVDIRRGGGQGIGEIFDI